MGEEASDYDSFYQPGFIDCDKWLKRRWHLFPEPAVIREELTKTLDAIKRGRMHPIEAAAKLWVDIMCIHPVEWGA